MNFTRYKQTHKENRLMVTIGEGAGGINWEFRINRNTLRYAKQMPNSVLLYSTEFSIL